MLGLISVVFSTSCLYTIRMQCSLYNYGGGSKLGWECIEQVASLRLKVFLWLGPPQIAIITVLFVLSSR